MIETKLVVAVIAVVFLICGVCAWLAKKSAAYDAESEKTAAEREAREKVTEIEEVRRKRA